MHVEDENGITPIQIATAKVKAVLSQVGPNGKTGYEEKGAKTRATSMIIGPDGLTVYQRQALDRQTRILPNGLTVEANAHLKQQATLAANGVSGRRASNASRKALAPILDWLNLSSLKYHFDNEEFGTWCESLNQFVYF